MDSCLCELVSFRNVNQFEILAQETISTDPFFQRAIVQVAAVDMQIIALLKTLDDNIR